MGELLPEDQLVKLANPHSLEIDEEVLRNVHAVIDRRAIVSGVVGRDDEYTEIEVVGESFYQKNLSTISNGKPGLESGWHSGLLMPEPKNKYDRNAIAVYLIVTAEPKYFALQVGYLERNDAAEFSKAIAARLSEKGEIVPFLGRITGGEANAKQNYGVSARVFWDFQ